MLNANRFEETKNQRLTEKGAPVIPRKIFAFAMSRFRCFQASRRSASCASVQPYSAASWSAVLRAFNAGGSTSQVRFPFKGRAERRFFGEPVEHAGKMVVGVRER